MSSETNIALVAAAASIAGGLLSGVFEAVKDWFTRPILCIDYEGGGDNVVESTYFANGQPVDDIFVRVRVTNKGSRIAKDCRIFLVGLHQMIDGHAHPTNLYDSKELAWAGYPKDFSARPLPKGISSYADVISVTKGRDEWNFNVRQLFSSQSELRHFKGTYRFKIAVTSDNATPAYCFIDVHYSGNWKNLRAFQSLV